jgi:glycosyltransferase involved in cell wall biosynthesis
LKRNNDITVAIPSIPPRRALLSRAINSVADQTLHPVGLSIAMDWHKEGAAITRQRALDGVHTPWVAFLDDDDEFKADHLEKLMRHAEDTGADYVYSWFETVPGGCDPFPHYHYTNPFNPAYPIQTTITVLVRTGLAKEVGFAHYEDDGGLIDGQRWGEDYAFTLGCVQHGAIISHLVDKTWYWHHDSHNTSGRADRW